MQELLDLDVALTKLLERIEPPSRTTAVTLDASRGRVAAENVLAPVSLPPFPSSAMDGYAVRTADFDGAPPHSLDVQGVSRAGAPFADPLDPGRALRIFTGAALPHGADAVIVQEDTFADGDHLFTRVTPRVAQHVREIGNDVLQGDLLIPRGQRLGPFQQAWLSACGIRRVAVFHEVRVSLFATGDELVEPGETLAAGQIYESNRSVLIELMTALPVRVRDLGILPDQPDVLGRELEQAASDSDVIVTSGGVSVGDADYVRDVVESIGAIEFWRLALKPGKPLAYGRVRDAAFFGLPGNPVSTIITFLLVVKPALQKWAGMTPTPPLRVTARLESALRHAPGRAEYQRGRLSGAGSELTVTDTGDQGSNRLGSFRGADCLIEIPKGEGDLEPGALVTVLPFAGLLD